MMAYIALVQTGYARKAAGVLVVALASPLALAETAAEAYRAMGIRPADVLTGTVLSAKVLPGADKQVVAVTTYFTGSKGRDDAVGVRLDVFARGQGLTRLYGREFGQETAGPVAAGELQLVDLDMDGVSEIIASYQTFKDPLIEQRVGEVILHDEAGFRTAWSGPLRYDATKAAREIPLERRDRYEREIDISRTLGTRGITLFCTKTVIAVAGERLPQPKVVQETFPLRQTQER
jgi:hypothetical protein